MGKHDVTAADYNERERLTKYSEARKDAGLPYVTEVYSLCTDDCEAGHHVPDFRTCARCGALIHKRIIEIFHPELGDLIVGSECVNDIMGWKWSTSHEQAWETGIALEQYLDRIKMPAAIMSKYKGGVLLNATMRNDLGVDIFRWDRHQPSYSNPLSRYVSTLHFAAGYVSLPHGLPDRLVRAGQDLGFIWIPLRTGYYLIAARGADYEKPHWVTFNASKPQLAEVRIQGGEAETRDEAAKLAERSVQEHWFKEIDKYNDPQYILSAVYEFRFIEAEPTPVGKQKLPTAHVLVDPDLSRIWNTRTQKLMENPVALQNPVRKRKTDDERFVEEVSITDYFHAGSPKAMEALGGESEDVSCVRCGSKISHVFMTQYGPMGGDCIATLTGDDSTRKAIRTLIENLKRSKMMVEGEGQGRLTGLEIEFPISASFRGDVAFRTEAYWFDRARYASRTVAVVKASPAAVAAAVEWAEGNSIQVKMQGTPPWERKQNPCPCSKERRRQNPHRPTFKDYIRGEWWIDKDGVSMFADGDIGEQNHDGVATDYMVDKDTLIDGLLENEYITEEGADEYRSDEVTPSQIIAEKDIPTSIGKQAVGGNLQKWIDLTSSPSMAFAKHEGAIKVLGTDFYAYKVNDKTIRAIQSFILEQTEGETIDDADTEICLHEHETDRLACLPAMKFLTLGNAKELWTLMETPELWDTVLKNPAPPKKLSTHAGWASRPIAKVDTLVVVKQGRYYFLAHQGGLQLGKPWTNQKYATDKMRFYTKDPKGQYLLAYALVQWGQGKLQDPVFVDISEDLSFNNWLYGRKLDAQKKTRRS